MERTVGSEQLFRDLRLREVKHSDDAVYAKDAELLMHLMCGVAQEGGAVEAEE